MIHQKYRVTHLTWDLGNLRFIFDFQLFYLIESIKMLNLLKSFKNLNFTVNFFYKKNRLQLKKAEISGLESQSLWQKLNFLWIKV